MSSSLGTCPLGDFSGASAADPCRYFESSGEWPEETARKYTLPCLFLAAEPCLEVWPIRCRMLLQRREAGA